MSLSNESFQKINESLSLLSREGGLTFGTDAYLLSAFIRNGKNGLGADLGTGTGVISLFAAARRNYSKIDAFEIQQDYAELAAKNAELNHLDDIIKVHQNDIRSIPTSLFGKYDTVWSNPPYFPKNEGFNNANSEMAIARRELNGNIRDFCSCASKLLKTGGHFFVVFRTERLSELLFALSAEHLEPKKMLFIYPKEQAKSNLFLVDAQKGAKPSVLVSKPLITNGPDGTYTEDMKRIYDSFSLDFLFKENDEK